MPKPVRVLFLSDAFLFLANPEGNTQIKTRSFDPFRQALIDTFSESVQLLLVKANDIYCDNSVQPHFTAAENCLVEEIKAFQPDWIITLNCAGLTPALRQAAKKTDGCDIPALCWYLDSYKRINPMLQDFKPQDQLFLTGKGAYQDYFMEQFGVPPEQVHTLPFCTDPAIFCLPQASAPMRDLDVCFVGTCFRSHHLNHWLSLVSTSGPSNLSLFLKHYDAHKAEYQYDLIRNMTADGFDWSFLTEEQRASYQERLLPILDDQLSAEVRLRMLSAMAEFNLAIYGEPDDGWLNAIGLVDSRLFRAYRFQPIATPTALAALYHRSKIALNVPHHQASTHSLPIRVFDIMASGALLLTPASTVGALTSIGYQEGVDFVAGATPAEMTERARYYLEHEDERQAITRSARQKVLQYHTLKAVVERFQQLATQGNGSISFEKKQPGEVGLQQFQLPEALLPNLGKPVPKVKNKPSQLKRLIYTKLPLPGFSTRWRFIVALEKLGATK